MAVVQFDYVPSYSSSTETTPRVNLVRFGDGYIQRGATGINIYPEKWSLTFNHLTDSQVTEMVNKLKSAAGGTVQWKPAPAAELDPYRNWICLSWTVRKNDYNDNSLSTEFEEVFE